jgi:hypothetical protein
MLCQSSNLACLGPRQGDTLVKLARAGIFLIVVAMGGLSLALAQRIPEEGVLIGKFKAALWRHHFVHV